MFQPTPVAPESPQIVLDQNFAENRVEALSRLGAANAGPPLVRSTHLKNKFTGLVLPWSQGLAEQRDLMVNCDASGNTDPAAWESSVNPAEFSMHEREMAYLATMQAVQKSQKEYQQDMPASMKVGLNDPTHNTMPFGARPLDAALNERSKQIVQELSALV